MTGMSDIPDRDRDALASYDRLAEDGPEYAPSETPAERLEYLRGELRAERISWSELHELQTLGDEGHIPDDDVEMREAAGLPEFPS